jgi:hypothetical protein
MFLDPLMLSSRKMSKINTVVRKAFSVAKREGILRGVYIG